MEKRIYQPLKEYFKEWRQAQDICIHLLFHPDVAIRANAVLGLSYIARNL